MSWLAWGLLSAAFAAATAILAKIGIEKLDSNLATAIRTSVIFGFSWVVVVATIPISTISQQLNRKTLTFLILSGLTAGLSWLCYFRALKLGDASRVAPIDKLSVVIVVVMAWFFLGERLSPMGIAGVAMITVGVVLVAIQ